MINCFHKREARQLFEKRRDLRFFRPFSVTKRRRHRRRSFPFAHYNAIGVYVCVCFKMPNKNCQHTSAIFLLDPL